MPDDEERDERQMVYLRFLKVMFMVQFFHGIALVVCGALAVQYSERRTGIFKESHKNGADHPHDTAATLDPTGTDPSYYIGAFPVGILVIMMGVVSYFVYQRAGAIHANVQVDVKQFSGLICLEQGLCVTTCLTALIGFFICVIYGVASFRYCTPLVSDHVCIYTAHITEHKILATIISFLTLVAVSNSVLIMCCSCANGRQMIDICSQRYGPLMKSAGNQGVSYQATSLTSEINKDSQSCTASPTGAMSRSSDYSNIMGQAYSSNPSVEELRNRNHLLQEQIDYQTVQLSVPHQRSSRETEVTTPMNTPPPSYEESVSGDDLMRHLHKLDKMKPQKHSELEQERGSKEQRPVPSAPQGLWSLP